MYSAAFFRYSGKSLERMAFSFDILARGRFRLKNGKPPAGFFSVIGGP